jgi:integrase
MYYFDDLATRPVAEMTPSPSSAKAEGLQGLHALESPYVFTSERGGPMSAAGFRKQLARWGVKAKLRFPVNPHMLRHACGYALTSGLPGPRIDHAHGELHGDVTDPVQGDLAVDQVVRFVLPLPPTAIRFIIA